MRLTFPIMTRRLLLLNAAGIGLLVTGGGRSHAAMPLHLSFDRPIDGTMAPFMLAAAKGLFRAEGLTVATDIAAGPQDAIKRVASGASEFALADLNALIRFRDESDAQPVKAVFVLCDKAPYAVIARRSRGINALSDMEGKTLGVAEGDLTIRFWPALARRNNINTEKVKIEKIGAAVREPMLSAGQVDAVTGFSYLSAINLRDRGIPASDLAVLRFTDLGCEAYGQAIIVNTKFAADNPDTVKGFIRATIEGLRLTVKDPGSAIDDVVVQMDGASRDLELERLRVALRDNIITDDVRDNGVGAVDSARFKASIEAIAADFKFRKSPTLHDVFDDSFLPPPGERKLN
jgi:NitT/TauT family transport system substrate-binding protein